MTEKNLLPVRIVQPSRDFLHKDKRRGGSAVRFFITDKTEYNNHRRKLVTGIIGIEDTFKDKFEEFHDVPVVIKAQLRSEALAKSHRPKSIFQIDTCPIIGLDHMGELLVSATKPGLIKLKQRIETPKNEKQAANITAIKKIKSFENKEKLQGLDIKTLKIKATRDKKTFLKIILFDHHDKEINQNVRRNFIGFVKKLGLDIDDISKLKNLSIWRVTGANEEHIQNLCEHPAVRVVSFFPTFRVVVPKELLSKGEKFEPPTPIEGAEYPKVGVIDSGIPEGHPFLASWVIGRTTYVPNEYANFKHGSFVSGLTCMAHRVNGPDICPDAEMIQIVDLHMIPDQDKDTVTEDILIERLQESIPDLTKKHDVKIWNMSAGFHIQTEMERFSSLAIYLDQLQDETDILITLPSGNYTSKNQRRWPPQGDVGESDRLQVPGDSIRAITVGSLACKEKPGSIVKLNQPASYSCKGPGPTSIPKPELVQYSGNLSLTPSGLDFSGQGIQSFDEYGNIVEDVGTSYSCPLIARTLSLIHYNIDPYPSSNMIKALAIHHSKLPIDLGPSEEIFPYVGFGMPPDLVTILHCTESDITLIFEQEIYEGHILEYPFVWPDSLKDETGKCHGNVKITIVAQTPLDGSYGSEYVRANVRASLQSIKKDENGEIKITSRLHEIPDTSKLGKLYEKELILHGYKWKPIKRYMANFKKIDASDWRIRIHLLLRDGVNLGLEPIKFVMIFTLSDPDKKANVYNEVVASLRTKNVITNPIRLRSRIRQKVRS